MYSMHHTEFLSLMMLYKQLVRPSVIVMATWIKIHTTAEWYTVKLKNLDLTAVHEETK